MGNIMNLTKDEALMGKVQMRLRLKIFAALTAMRKTERLI